MADFNDVINQLQKNNEDEKERDSNLNRNIANLRTSNTRAAADIQKQIFVGQGEVKDIEEDKPTAAQLEEDTKNKNLNDKKTRSIFEKMSDNLKGVGAALTSGFKTITGGEGTFGKIVRGTLLAALFGAIAAFFGSPYYQQTIDYIFKTLIPKLQFFYDQFFGPEGGFMKGIKALFSDESGIGYIVIGLGSVTALIVGFKLVTMFGKIKDGVSSLGGFLGRVGGFFKKLVLPNKMPTVPPVGGGGPPGSQRGPGMFDKFTKSIKTAGKNLGGFISGILRGVASGLALISAPPVLIGLLAVAAAAIAISTAIRIMTPAFEPIGAMFKKFGEGIREAFGGLSTFIKDVGKAVEGVIGQIGKSIGEIVDKISNMKSAATEAQTKQIQELSKIPADKITAVAKGVDKLKEALDDFGGGTFASIAKNLFGGDGPLTNLVKLTEKVDEIMKVAQAIDVLAKAGGDYEMAKAELTRREDIVKLEAKLAKKGSYNTRQSGIDAKAADEAKLKALREQEFLVPEDERQFGGRVKAGSLYLVNEGGSEMFIPDQPGMMMSANRTAQIMREGSGAGNRDSGTIIVNAPQDNKVTTTTSNTTSSSVTMVNPDPIIQSAMA